MGRGGNIDLGQRQREAMRGERDLAGLRQRDRERGRSIPRWGRRDAREIVAKMKKSAREAFLGRGSEDERER